MDTNKFQRNTRQRQLVLQELKEFDTHPTASEIYQRVRERLPKISLATVYRTLESLATMGVIRKLETVGPESRFEGNLEPHHHLRCRVCGRFEDLYRIPSAADEDRLDNWRGWQISGIRVEYSGVCPGCRGKQGKEGEED
jgi:Fur family ferric uptake transcriptional regulator